MLILSELVQGFPGTDLNILSSYVEPLNSTMARFQIDASLNRAAAFLANVGYESGGFRELQENLHYSAETLLRLFPSMFDQDTANQYAMQPEKIANKIYANRMGNGDEASGDGWRYRGMGLIQLTGKQNQEACFAGLGVTQDQSWLLTNAGSSLSAGWFWNSRNLNNYADKGDFNTIVQRINGGFNGLSDRTNLYNKLINILRA